LTSYKWRAVIGGTMAAADALPFQLELSQADYFVLLEAGEAADAASARLIAAAEQDGPSCTRPRPCPRLSGR